MVATFDRWFVGSFVFDFCGAAVNKGLVITVSFTSLSRIYISSNSPHGNIIIFNGSTIRNNILMEEINLGYNIARSKITLPYYINNAGIPF